MTESTIRVVLVDDDAMVRSALRMFLGGDQGIAIVGEAGDGAHALAVVREHRPDVVLMDIRMPLVDGLAATEAIMGWPQPPRIIVLTTFDTDEDVLHALRSGAAGFLLKDTPPGQLGQAIRTGTTERPRTRGGPSGGPWPVERRDLWRALLVSGHGQDAHRPDPEQARSGQSGPDRAGRPGRGSSLVGPRGLDDSLPKLMVPLPIYDGYVTLH